MKRNAGIILKSKREIELMRAAGKVVFNVHQRMKEEVREGVTTADLNTIAEQIIEEAGGIALFKGVEFPDSKFAFPAALCTSVNDELVHGIPSDRVLKNGDIISIDCGVKLAGYCGDAANTLPVGPIDAASQKLLDVTKRSLDIAIEEIKPGRMWSEVATLMQKYVEGEGFSVVRNFVGHGIGTQMHEDPKVPNYWDSSQASSDFEIVPNLVIAVEPMVNAGSHRTMNANSDGWIIATKDGKNAAHFEHTIAVTENGSDVLTAG